MPQKITTAGDPILRKRAQPVAKAEIGSKKIDDILKKMADTLRATDDGIGIAASQIGIGLRMFLASEEAIMIDKKKDIPQEDAKKKNWKYYTFINPEIIKISGKKVTTTEGCLSVPNKYGVVARAEKIRVRAYDETGKIFERGASNLFARLLQHEIDHLEGVLYVDRAEKLIDLK